MNPIRCAAAVLLVAALAACDRGAKSEPRDQAPVEVLPASVSDAMLQTDRLQAEAPIAEPVPTDDTDTDGSAKPDDAADERDTDKTPSRRRRTEEAPAAKSAPPTAAVPAAEPTPE